MAIAADEILPLKDPRVKQNSDYFAFILLSRVITKLGDLELSDINPKVIKRLSTSDLDYLHEIYNKINHKSIGSISKDKNLTKTSVLSMVTDILEIEKNWKFTTCIIRRLV